MTRPDLDALEKLVNSWGNGTFYHEKALNDLAWRPASDDIEPMLVLGEVDGAAAQLATMLNALPALIAYARQVERELVVERTHSAGLYAGIQQRVEFENRSRALYDKLEKERDAARAEVERLKAAWADTTEAFRAARQEVQAAGHLRAEVDRLTAERDDLRGLVGRDAHILGQVAGVLGVPPGGDVLAAVQRQRELLREACDRGARLADLECSSDDEETFTRIRREGGISDE